MPDFRSYCQEGEADSGIIRLNPEESHHLVRVNRARAGDPVVAFDGRGAEYVCLLERPDGREAVLAVRERRKHAPLPYSLTLGQALPKGKMFENIVRHATEIGAARLAPLVTERTEVRLDEKRSPKKEAKWRTTAIEAAKQCGTPFVPEVLPVTEFSGFAETAGEYDLTFFAGLTPSARPLAAFLPDRIEASPDVPCRVLWLVGPEGDFTPDEISRAEDNGFRAVTLGPYVLRCETAALYALSITSYELGLRVESRL